MADFPSLATHKLVVANLFC